ncbi:MAG: methyltransferase, TIGR04325 family [bacterium]
MFETIRLLCTAALDIISPSTRIHYNGNFTTWNAAVAACKGDGYTNESILEKVRQAQHVVIRGEAAFERDSALFKEPEYHWPLLALLFQIYVQQKSVSVLDFGGSLGSTYFQNRKWLDRIPNIRWCIVEQPHFVECGNREFSTEHLRFYKTMEDCMANERISIVLFASVLGYLQSPWEVIKYCINAKINYIMIDQTVMSDGIGKERLVVQSTPATIYRAKYPLRIFREKDFHDMFCSEYICEASVPSFNVPVVLTNPWLSAQYKGFIWRKK